MIKHQANCYRNIKDTRYTNYADLIQGDEEMKKIIAEAMDKFKKVKLIKHWTGEYMQLFVAEPITN